MSSDARVRFQADGMLRGSHDGECVKGHEHPCVSNKYDLVLVLQTIEECMGKSLAWEIRDGGDEGPWLAGYMAR